MLVERQLYFAYGANMHPGQMAWRCPQALAHGAFILRDWELKLYSHATIDHRPGMSVGGVLWEITPECEKALDRLEGYPHFYDKKTVKVKHNGRKVDAMIYYMTNHYGVDYPSKHYLDMVIEGYLEHRISVVQIDQALEVVDAHSSRK